MFEDKSNLFVKFNPKNNEVLAPYTSWKIGGPADILIESANSGNLAEIIHIAIENNISYTILGGGSDVLISDHGIRGLVIINKSKNVEILDSSSSSNNNINQEESEEFNPWIQPRHGEADSEFYTFEDLDYVETGTRGLVKFDSGVDLPYAIAWGLKNQLTGLQFFAGIPGTIGGALYNNIHGGTKHFSDYFYSATVIDAQGNKKELFFKDFEFGYDQSILRISKELVVLDVTLNLYHGDTDKARFVATEWTKRKRRQPRKTAGCNFKNIPLDEQKRLGFPTPSVGYVVDKLLGWNGKQIGDAIISPHHANFIENLGNAKAGDVLELIKQIKSEVKLRYNLELETEINLLGFDD